MGLSNNQVQIWGLFMACPIKAVHEKCPFNAIRKKSLKERGEKLLQLSEAEAEALLSYCSQCLYYHEAGDLAALDKLEMPLTSVNDS